MNLIAIFTFILKFVGVTFVMYFVYMLLLRYKVSYNICRIYLICIPIVALAASCFTFKVLPVQYSLPQSVGASDPSSFTGFIESNSYLQSDILDIETIIFQQGENIAEVGGATTNTHILTQQGGITPSLDNSTSISRFKYGVILILALSILFAASKLIVLSIQMKKILSIRRWSTKEIYKGTTIYRSGLIDGAFSFFRDIYIARSAEGDKLDVIVEHEKSHVSNHHYIDKFIIEVFSALMWFNPFIWIIRKELGTLHEFQADSEVVNSGIDIKNYKLYLFEEIATDSPIIANGFNHSMVKKRLITLGSKKSVRFVLTRGVVAFVAMMAVFILTSFVSTDHDKSELITTNTTTNSGKGAIDYYIEDVAEEIISTNDEIAVVANDNPAIIETDALDIKIKATDKNNITATDTIILSDNHIEQDTILHQYTDSLSIVRDLYKDKVRRYSTTAQKEMQEIMMKTQAEIALAEIEIAEIATGLAATTVATSIEKVSEIVSKISKATITNATSTDGKTSKNDWYDLPADKTLGLPEYIIYNSKKVRELRQDRIIGIRHSETETFVDFIVRPANDSWWCIFSSRTFLKDKRTEDMYKIRRLENDVPLDKFLVIKGHKYSFVTFTLVFPRLDTNVKIVDFIEYRAPHVAYPSNSGATFNYNDIYIKDFEKNIKSTSNIIK